MKVKSEDILKPGAVLVVEEIDWSTPEMQKLLRETRRRQRWLEKQKNKPFKNVTITI